MSKFIQTKDPDTREALLKAGLKEVSKSYGVYLFLNDKSKMNFNKNNLKITYTNKISI